MGVSIPSVTNNVGNMKVLKKIKRRMGLAPRSAASNGTGTNNLPPLLFHNVHGDHIRLSRDGTIANRVESFCKGITFSSRPIKVNEKVLIRFLEISNNWSGVIRFGFTCNDPSSLRYGLPKYACPDLTNKPGYWAKALPDRFCGPNVIVFYYINNAGEVHFGVDGEEKGIFFGGVDTRVPLWALVDVYGNTTAIEFVDMRRHLLNNDTSNTMNYNNMSSVGRMIDVASTTGTNANNNMGNDHLDISSHLELMNLRNNDLSTFVPMLRYQPARLAFMPMLMHTTHGRNVRFYSCNNSNHAYRAESEFCQGYVFTARPLQIGEHVVVQVLGTEPMFQGCLGLGLTSCDPATLDSSDLPDDSNCLLDRPEYWVISRDFGRTLDRGDEVSFSISERGEVQISRNGAAPLVVIHVDQTLRLWAFFDIYGSTQRIRLLHSPVKNPVINRNASLLTSNSTLARRNSFHGSSSSSSSSSRSNNVGSGGINRLIIPHPESINSLNSQSEIRSRHAQHEGGSGSDDGMCFVATPTGIQLQHSSNGGAVLSLLLPPPVQQYSTSICSSQRRAIMDVNCRMPSVHSIAASLMDHSSNKKMIAPAPKTTQLEKSNNIYSTARSCTGGTSSNDDRRGMMPTNMGATTSTANGAGGNGGASVFVAPECTICYEHPIDAVLYTCGHMCMCYECALQQWRGKGGGHCPLCRAVIRDVIRTYKS